MQPELKPKWEFPVIIPPEIDEELGDYSPVLRQLLFNRGITDSEQANNYLVRDGSLYDPMLFTNMDKAVQRIWQAIDQQEKIAVYGDYDVDGVTATALLVQVFRRLGGNVREYIPNRFEEGYGLNNEALDVLFQDDVRLVITVDCGIRSPVEAEHARELGLDLIISDHHEPEDKIPFANAIICQKQEGDLYPEKNLAGVGLAFKIAEALVNLRPGCDLNINDWLDLVAIGTVADIVPLKGENRTLVKAGMKLLRFGKRQGLLSLANVARLAIERITARDIGFMIGPRLNAAGRLESAMAAFNLLMADDVNTAGILAQRLDDRNKQRQDKTREMFEEADKIIGESDQGQIILAVSENFEMGIVGLVASRLVDAYYRPAIVASKGEEYTRASCRSIPEFDITHALDECSTLFKRHGGHAMAAGFTILNEHLPELESRLKEIGKRELEGRSLQPIIRPDLEINLDQIKPDRLLKEIDLLEPTGMGNPGALFESKNIQVLSKYPVGEDKRHLKLKITGGKIVYDAIAFRQGYWLDLLPDRIDMVYNFEKNSYNGRETIQLNVRDIKKST